MDQRHEDTCAIVLRGKNLLDEWSRARKRNIGMQSHPAHNPGDAQVCWNKPSMGFVKCNIDASFLVDSNQVGIGICLRDELFPIMYINFSFYT